MALIEKALLWEARVMTRREVIQKAMEGKITWLQASQICSISPRHMLRLRERYQKLGDQGLRDGRQGKRQPFRIDPKVVDEVCRLKREVYEDFSVRHFHQFITEKHKIRIGYTWTRIVLQRHGLVEIAPGRGRHLRRRERRPMVGMLLHQDASTHAWLEGLPPQDLVVMLDDADGRVLYGRFFPQEGTLSTLASLKFVFQRYGRFCEFYTDRGSHFCHTEKKGDGPDEVQQGQVARVLRGLGIRHILARTPQARGRSERAFGTIQGRLPQELRLAGIRTYNEANDYLDRVFWPDFNHRFVVKPTQPESAFTSLAGLDLDLLVSIQHERVVGNDNCVRFDRLLLQLPASSSRAHFARCPVLVHEFLDDSLGVSFQGQLLARFDRTGALLQTPAKRRAA
jgi:hypothetical protein